MPIINRKQPLAVAVCFVLWGLLPVFWKMLAQVNALYILAARILWCMLFAGVLLLLRGQGGKALAALRDRRELCRLAVASALLCVNWGCYIWAVNSGHLLDSSLAYYMNPLLSILLGTLMLGEKLSRLQWASVALAATGVLITLLYYRQIPWVALAIGGSFALYGVLKKGAASEAVVSMFVESLVPAPLAIACLIWMDGRGLGAIGVLEGAQLLLLPLAGVITGVPLMLYAWGIKGTPYTLAGTLMYVNPTLQLLLGVFLYKEEFTVIDGVLFGFVWVALTLYMIGQRRQKQHEIKENEPKCE